jgi:hypothetical protein
VKNEEMLRIAKEEGNILQTIKRKANWIGQNLRKNCLLKHVSEGKIEEENVSSYWMTLRK